VFISGKSLLSPGFGILPGISGFIPAAPDPALLRKFSIVIANLLNSDENENHSHPLPPGEAIQRMRIILTWLLPILKNMDFAGFGFLYLPALDPAVQSF